MNEPRLIDIDDLTLDPELQERVFAHPEIVALLARAMKTEEAVQHIPPIRVFRDGRKHWVGDGYLRVAAARQAGRSRILAVVRKGIYEDALWAFVTDNAGRKAWLTQEERDWIARCEHTLAPEQVFESNENRPECREEPPAPASETVLEKFIREFEEQCSWQRIARSIANRYGMAHYRNFVFTDARINDAYHHILGFGVALMKKKFDPTRGVKETTFLYKIMTCLAIDEYRRIVAMWRRRREGEYSEESKEHAFWAEEFGRSCNGLAAVDRDDTFRLYATVTDDEMKSVKRQYLPRSLRDLPEKQLQQRLSEIDRQIVDRLAEGGTLNDVRKEFESLPENGGGTVDHRQFFENRRIGNGMIGWQTGSVFIAGPLAECDDFFLVDRFTTDGDRLCAVAQHDGTCRDIVGGWVYDLKHRRYVYGEGGPLEHDLR